MMRLVTPKRSSRDFLEKDSEEGSDSDSGTDRGPKRQPDVCAEGAAHYVKSTLSEIIFGSSLNVLLLCTPFALYSGYRGPNGFGHAWTFTFSMLALIPFAERVSFVTEDVAKYTNDTLGGLLNATFGNVTELIVCIFCLKGGLVRIVQLTMLGSVLSNLLLVLGSAFFIGGLRHKEQHFKNKVAMTNCVLLVIAVIALSLPSVLDTTHHGSGGNHTEIIIAQNESLRQSWMQGKGTLEGETVQGGDAPIWLSRFIATLMLIAYVLYLVFQLCTHTSYFEGEAEDEDDEEGGVLGFWGGIFWLAVITCFITVLSDFIVDAIEGAAKEMGVPLLFLSAILIPIVGNAAEHAAAIVFAYRNKMEIALGSAVGSAVQIAVFVIPLCIIIGWAFGEDMSMNFHIFETSVLLLAVMSVAFVLMDGTSHWLKGVMLIFAYFMIAAAFWAHADPMHMD